MVVSDQRIFQELIRDMPISNAELARRSKVTEKTLIRMRDGRPAQRYTAARVLRALSEVYGEQLTLDNVTGINLD
jgi:predicted transcriptional regulator